VWSAGFILQGEISGQYVASIVMREPGTYLARTADGTKWCETEAEARAWCEQSVASASSKEA
jgi:hypothetical protein